MMQPTIYENRAIAYNGLAKRSCRELITNPLKPINMESKNTPSKEQVEGMPFEPLLPAVLVGYIILQNMHFRVGKNNVWEEIQTGFDLEFKKKIYPKKESAEEAVEQMKKLYKKDEFEIHPVYWYGR